jgi:cytochrome bd-type quinol oxidase subunit 2
MDKKPKAAGADEGEEDLDGELRSPAWKYLTRFQDLLGVSMVGFLLLLWWLASQLEKHNIKGRLVNLAFVAVVGVVIAAGIFLTRRNQRRAIARFHLKCKNCGYTPTASEIAVSEAMQECQRCNQTLHV